MALKDTKSPQEIIAEMKAEERRRLAKAEIEMEGATIRGAMPTFKNLTKTVDFGVSKVNPARRDLSHPTGQIFTLPNGKEIVLVPEAELPEFLFDDTIVGADFNEARDAFYDHKERDARYSLQPEVIRSRASYYADLARRGVDVTAQQLRGIEDNSGDTWEQELKLRLESTHGGAFNQAGRGVDPIKVLRPQAAEKYLKGNQAEAEDGIWRTQGKWPAHHLGGGFFVLLGVEQQYQPDKSSFGTYEMTADGPVRTDDGEPTTKSIPIVFYSDPNKPIEYKVTVGPYDRERAERGLEQISEKAYYPSLGMNLLNPDRNYTRKGYRSTSDTAVDLYNADESKIKPELIPDFTGRDVIDGYKAAKASAKAAPKPAPKVAPPQEIEPAPPPEPRPEPPSSFTGFGMPVVDTLKGRRRAAKRRFPGRQELTDE